VCVGTGALKSSSSPLEDARREILFPLSPLQLGKKLWARRKGEKTERGFPGSGIVVSIDTVFF
jgi:hypothetical protein